MVRLFFTLLFIGINVYAAVSAKLSKSEITLGDSVQLTVTGEGSNVIFPDIKEIAGFEVEGFSTAQNIQMINGVTKANISRVYTFTPTSPKVIEIPSFDLVVDGKKESTQQLKLTVKEQAAEANPNFELIMSANKSESFVGEQVNIKVLFRRRADVNVMDVDYVQSPFENMWVRQVGKENTYTEGDYIVHELNYIAFPQKSGELSISPSKMRVSVPKERKDFFGFIVQEPIRKNLNSNELKISSKPLPQGVKLVGGFKIEASVDKTQTEPNKPINLTLTISGSGNMDDIDDIELSLNKATVYADKPQKSYEVKNGEYGGVYKKSFSIVADGDFDIEPFTIKFFDPKTKSIKSDKTQKIEIKVLGPKPQVEDSKIVPQEMPQVNSESKQISAYQLLALFAGGIFTGTILTLLFRGSIVSIPKISIKKDTIKRPKTDREILLALLPFAKKDERIDKMLQLLEENLYLAKKHKIDKKELALVLKSIERKGVL